MKKVLLFAAAALSFAACTNEDIVENVTTTPKGITFEITNPETRGELTEKYNFFWYAETDQLNIYATNKNAVADINGKTGNELTVGYIESEAVQYPAVYKATQSAAKGLFTAKDDKNMLCFVGVGNDSKTNFIGAYPTTTTVKSWTPDGQNIKSVKVAVGATNETQNLKFGQVVSPMVAYSNGISRQEYYESVGEKVALSPERMFPVLRLSSTKKNETYNQYIGKLKSVDVVASMKSELPDGYDSKDLNIAATSATLEYVAGANPEVKNLVKVGGAENITVNIKDKDGSNFANWMEKDKININILPITPTIVKAGAADQTSPITFTFTYNYEHATLIDERTVNNTAVSFDTPHSVIPFAAWDIATKYNYIVTEENKLLVFAGSFNDIFNKDGNIKWNNGVVAPTAITAIYSEVALTLEEQKKIKNFTSVTSINLPNQTIIETDDVFQNCGDVTELILPKVTSYKDTKTTFSKLTTLDLGSYDFMQPNEDVSTKFFNDDVKATLKTLDIHSVTSLSPAFGYERNILFTDYATLETIKLSNEGTVISANEFSGCVKLKTVEGVINMSTATAAFKGASTDPSVTVKPTINVKTTEIPQDAFMYSDISDIKHNGAAIVPTYIGYRAFAHNQGIESLDLTQATEIGVSAFFNATKFIGAKKENGVVKNNGVVTLNVSTVETYAFSGTKVARFQLKNATTVKNNGLASTALKQIKFLQNVSKWNNETQTGIASNIVATPANVDLFIKSAADQSAFTQTFRTVTVDNTEWPE